MNIYFAGSIRGGRDDVVIYQEIISILKNFGSVLTEHVGDPTLTKQGNDGPDDGTIYKRDMKWLNDSDVVVAEVSKLSLGVGYELGQASALNKPILALYRPQENEWLSAMIGGSPSIKVVEYKSTQELKQKILNFVEANLRS